ncbi:MAG: chloride channel protein [Nitrospinota bacterium]
MIKKFQRLLPSLFTRTSQNQTVLLLVACLIGFLSGLAAILFEWLIDLCAHYFRVEPNALFGTSIYYAFVIVPLTPVVGGLIVGFVQWIFGMSKESASVADLMKWAAVDGGRVRKRTVLVRAFASSIFLGSGGSGGREGPIAQVCGALASTIGQWLNFSTERLRLLVGCGAAAGIAAAFNAPIAGVIFAVELILADYNVISFLPIVISSVTATATKRMIVGDVPAFVAPTYALASPYEILLYLLLGIICGLIGWLFFKSYFFADTFFKNHFKVHIAVKPALGGLVVGVIGVFLPEVFGNGYDAMTSMLTGNMILTTALLLIVFKIIATSAALGTGGSGGVFAPSLFIGCMVGGAFGYGVNYVAPFEVGSPGAYAMVGIGAVMAAVAHAPLTNILMGYELTGNYEIILPIMTACIISTYVMTLLSSESLYTEKLRRKGIKLWRGRDLTIMDRVTVSDIMRTNVKTINEDTPFREIMNLFMNSRDSYFPMIDSNDNLTGIISIQNIREVLNESDYLADIVVANEIATYPVITVHSDNNLNEAFIVFADIDIEQLPVVASDNPKKVVGLISRKDVIASYNKGVLLRSQK